MSGRSPGFALSFGPAGYPDNAQDLFESTVGIYEAGDSHLLEGVHRAQLSEQRHRHHSQSSIITLHGENRVESAVIRTFRFQWRGVEQHDVRMQSADLFD